MVIILGHTTDGSKRLLDYKRHNFGRMLVHNKFTPYEGELWGFDNGAFVFHKRGIPFDTTKFQHMLDYAYKQLPPYMAIVPDIMAGGEGSLEFSLSWLPRLPAEWPWYLAVQDGMSVALVEPQLHYFSGIFLGGSNEFKTTAPDWSALAHKHGKKFHYARAGTLRKVDLAVASRADSIDSSFPLWTKDRFAAFVKHIQQLRSKTC